MITADVNTSSLDAGMNGLITKVGLSPKVVIPKETGELIKTMVRVSPPKTAAKTRQSIASNVFGKFQGISDNPRGFNSTAGDVGPSGVIWYAMSEQYLFGVAADKDMTKASVEELRGVYYKLNSVAGKTRQVLNFKRARKVQRVALSQRIITTKGNLTKLAKRLQGHIGRLKAGWCAAVFKGSIKLSGQLPQAVNRHQGGVRGYHIDGLANKETPFFVIANTAKGVSQKTVTHFAKTAVAIRAKAMAANTKLFLSGKKNLSDYAK